jgi:hypothetical protein
LWPVRKRYYDWRSTLDLLKPFWQEATPRASQKLIIYFLQKKVSDEINGMDPVPHALYKKAEGPNVLEGMRLYRVAQLSNLVYSHQAQLPPEFRDDGCCCLAEACRNSPGVVDLTCSA